VDNRLSELLHSGGQHGHYRSSNYVVYNRYHGYQAQVRFLIYLAWLPYHRLGWDRLSWVRSVEWLVWLPL
jgi:hypothetical protein